MDRVCVSGASCSTHVTSPRYRRASPGGKESASDSPFGGSTELQVEPPSLCLPARRLHTTLAEVVREKFSIANEREDMRGEVCWRLREVI